FTIGKMNNEEELLRRAFNEGHSHFQEMSGGKINATELVASLICKKASLVEGIRYAQKIVDGSLTLLLMTKDGLYAARDRFGRTPLVIGRKEDAYCVSFENFAYINLGYNDYKELGPGEVAFITPEGVETLVEPRKEMKICSFLWVYYGYPTSSYEGVNVEEMRYKCGSMLAKRDGGSVHPDIVAGVPDSGVAHAIGYANESGIPYARPFIKYTPTWPRSFMPTNQSQRNLIARMKLIPAGSGKTLASIKIALERAVQKKKQRIIYIIPYNSIIEQTADVFENLFGKDMEILRHQSTFSYEDEDNGSEDYRMAAKTAAENWDAPFIITTAVQFFESVYANKRGKLRKMHNMSDSILIFDEAHLMPQNYLQPCLQAVAYITRYLHSEAVFLTATMPDFEKLLKEYALPNCKIVRLIKDTAMFAKFQKCKYSYIGEVTPSELLARCCEYPSSLIIVNKKATARKLYQECGGKKYHLSTYMTSYDRKK